MKLKIGSLELKNRIIAGPMAGVTNQSFRKILKEFGAGLTVTEMVSDKAIMYANKKTLKMCEIDPGERPVALQLFGSDIESMIIGCEYLDKRTDCDIIDINMGCPVNKVVRNNGGSGLMKDPEHAGRLIRELRMHCEKPLTVKMRAGWDKGHINVVEMAVLMEKAGADALTIHPRTRTEFYTGHSNWDLIRQVKEAVRIPVIGNGDIRTLDDMIAMETQTGCDGFMVSRGVLGNPWLIRRLAMYDEEGIILPDPDYHERIAQCLRHADSLIALKGETAAIREMRGHACWYIDGLPKANRAKAEINFMNTREELRDILSRYEQALDSGDFSDFEKDR